MDSPRSPDAPALDQVLSHAEMRLVIFGVLLPVFMGSLDQTILASALPTIGRGFGDLRNLPWLITVYLIASTAVTPLYGKVSDIHGRRFAVNIGIVIYMVGSLVCALAPTMPVLIFGRVLHGLGGGGLSSMGMIVLGDLAPPKDRGKYYAYFSATYTTAGACGPALGGFFAEYLHWSVIFWCNIALGILALVLTNTLLRRLPRHERPHRLDFLGAGLIMASSVSFMLALNLGGAQYAWTSPELLALVGIALALGGGFVLRLMTAPEPLIPITILANPVAFCSIAANTFGWGSIIGLNIFLPMFLQIVLGMSAANAGLSLMVLMATVNTSAGFSGQLLGRVRHYKLVPLAGLVLAIAAVAMLGLEAGRLDPWTFEILLALLGIGFGPIPPLTSVTLQNVVVPHQFGTAVGTMNFSRSLTGTILVAVFGAIVLGGTGDPAVLARLAANHDRVPDAIALGFTRVFAIAAACLAISFIAVVFLEERPLKSSHS